MSYIATVENIEIKLRRWRWKVRVSLIARGDRSSISRKVLQGRE